MNEQFATLKMAGTAVIADVFDTLKIEPPVLDNHLFAVGEAKAFVGPAFTVTGKRAVFEGGDRTKLEAIDSMTEGSVAVWAGQDAEGVCCFGDLLGSAMKARGCVAAVVDGGVRDVAFLRELELTVMTRYRTPAQGVGRWKVSEYQVPVQMRGALREWLTVTPGDIIVGDGDGVICVPKDLVDSIVTKVKEWSEAENEAREDILGGLPLLAALQKYGHL